VFLLTGMYKVDRICIKLCMEKDIPAGWGGEIHRTESFSVSAMNFHADSFYSFVSCHLWR
ncbi:hypothetical protein, partial [Dialister hominis]|uniref:hypothetical protein n=1 Tax=Dialister hominis TaxID=2582419 RepID=UPI003AB5036B